MRKMNVTFGDEFQEAIFSKVEELNQNRTDDPYLVSIAKTLHHETGQVAYILGCSLRSASPPTTLVDTGAHEIALYMEPDDMNAFEDAKLVLDGAYVKLR